MKIIILGGVSCIKPETTKVIYTRIVQYSETCHEEHLHNRKRIVKVAP